MKPNYILYLFFYCFYIFCDHNENEFIIKKNSKNNSISKIRESIITNAGNILKININLDKSSISLREFLLNEIDKYLNQDDESFLNNSDKKQLQEAFNELIDLKKMIKRCNEEMDEKLKKLKGKFKF